jgi:hypothetical protein
MHYHGSNFRIRIRSHQLSINTPITQEKLAALFRYEHRVQLLDSIQRVMNNILTYAHLILLMDTTHPEQHRVKILAVRHDTIAVFLAELPYSVATKLL